jgi:hydrogenase nickel incorporation protein HypA/HybF
MHEVYVAENLLDVAIEKCKEKGFNYIKSIKIKIGKASVISTEALIFAFDVLKIGSIANDASLIIEEISTFGFCKDCGKEFTVEKDFLFECPFCKSDYIIIKSGNGVQLEELDVEV